MPTKDLSHPFVHFDADGATGTNLAMFNNLYLFAEEPILRPEMFLDLYRLASQ